MTRQAEILDAAIETLGTRGMRGLTHRAVDQVAGLPACLMISAVLVALAAVVSTALPRHAVAV